MSLYGSGIECGLHCLLFLIDPPAGGPPSSRDMAEYQGVSPSFVAKIFTQMQKAGLVTASEGVRGGFALARTPEQISVLDVVDAIEGDKPLFRCREIRRNCVLYDDDPPDWTTRGVCQIHAVMLDAEKCMRASLAETSLADIARQTTNKVPGAFLERSRTWFEQRQEFRGAPGVRPSEKE